MRQDGAPWLQPLHQAGPPPVTGVSQRMKEWEQIKCPQRVSGGGSTFPRLLSHLSLMTTL